MWHALSVRGKMRYVGSVQKSLTTLQMLIASIAAPYRPIDKESYDEYRFFLHVLQQ